MDRARYAVDAVVLEGRSLRSVAASLDMSKSWVEKHVSRFRAGGYEALAPHSRAPHRRPTQLDAEIENEIVMIRKQLSEDGFDAGPLTIQYHLGQRHGKAPGRSTIHRALVRRGFVVPQPQKRPRTSWVRFEAHLPNETWQADMTHWSLLDENTGRDPRLRRRLLEDGHRRRRAPGHHCRRRGGRLLPGSRAFRLSRVDVDR
jgi:transposase